MFGILGMRKTHGRNRRTQAMETGIQKLRALVETVRCGSISGAARELDYS